MKRNTSLSCLVCYHNRCIMEFYYVLAIVYFVGDTELDTQILFESSSECSKALVAAEPLSNTLPADLYCISTGRLSKSIRPVLRPSAQSEVHQ